MKNIYKSLYSKDKKLYLRNNPRIRVMCDMVNDLSITKGKILDFGCLDGTFIDLIKTKTNSYYGCDASDFAIEQCNKKEIHTINYFFDDIKPLPYESCFFDLVILGEVLEHIYDTDFMLKEVYRILKTGGLLLISTPNVASLGRRLNLLIGNNPLIELSPNESDSSGHIRYFTFETLVALATKHGFIEKEVHSDVINLDTMGRVAIPAKIGLLRYFGASIICLFGKK